MANLQEIIQYLDTLLETDKFQLSDKNINGLQVDSSTCQKTQEVRKVCVSVDPGFEIFHKAKDLGADLLILHHGLIYGDNRAITGSYRDKIAFLLNNNISLYSSHLPLDKHIEYGNASVIAQKIGLKNLSPAFEYKGVAVGVTGEVTKETDRDDVLKSITSIIKDYDVRALFYGAKKVKRIGIATGAAAFSMFDIPKYNLTTKKIIFTITKCGNYIEDKISPYSRVRYLN